MLAPVKDTLIQNLIGIEKESLRVSEGGSITQEPHPETYGSALTNPAITTDFSEALIELVTKPFDSAAFVSFCSQTQLLCCSDDVLLSPQLLQYRCSSIDSSGSDAGLRGLSHLSQARV